MSYELTDLDMVWLYVGLIPLLVLLYNIARHGSVAAAKLVSVAVLVFWVQYHLSPWLSLRTLGWHQFLLRGEYVSDCLKFSSLMIISIVAGHGPLVKTGSRNTESSSFIRNGIRSYVRKIGNMVDDGTLIALSLVIIFFIFLQLALSDGSLSGVFISEHARGFGQFEEKSAFEQFATFLSIFAVLSGAVAAVCVTMTYSKVSGLNAIILLPAVVVLIYLSSSPLTFKFSRMSGGMFFLSAAALQMSPTRQKGRFLVQVMFALLGSYFCLIGITHRAISPSGVWSFLSAALDPNVDALQSILSYSPDGAWVIGPSANFLDAAAPFTARAWASQGEIGASWSHLKQFLLILQPLPAIFFGEDDLRVGASLSIAYGTYGRTGLTTPALAELFVLFGYGSVILGFLYGRLLKAADRMMQKKKSIWAFLVYALLIAGIVVAGHSGLRAFARPTILAMILMLALTYGIIGRKRPGGWGDTLTSLPHGAQRR